MIEKKSPGGRRSAGKETDTDVDSETDCILDPRLLQDQRCDQRNPDGSGQGARGSFFGRPSPLTFGEVDSRAKRLGAVSFRTSSPTGAEEPLEVESYDHRRFGRPAANFSHCSEGKKAGCKTGQSQSHQ